MAGFSRADILQRKANRHSISSAGPSLSDGLTGSKYEQGLVLEARKKEAAKQNDLTARNIRDINASVNAADVRKAAQAQATPFSGSKSIQPIVLTTQQISAAPVDSVARLANNLDKRNVL